MVTVTSESITGSLNEYDLKTPEVVQTENPVLAEIRDATKILKKELEGIPLKQAFGNLMVGSLIELQNEAETKDQKVEAYKKAQGVLVFFETLSGDEWPSHKSGFLAEVAVAITLEKAGFTIKSPSQEDDLKGKIDLWADANDGTVFAVQIKTGIEIPKIDLHKIDAQKENLGVPEGYKTTAESMIKYVRKNKEFGDLDIIPIIIELPGGEHNPNATFNQTTGEPLKKTTDHLLDLFYKEFWND